MVQPNEAEVQPIDSNCKVLMTPIIWCATISNFHGSVSKYQLTGQNVLRISTGF